MALAPLDFPPSPIVGQTYPSPPVTGQPTYTWDGLDWISKFALGKEYVPLDGSTAMTGLLTLFGDPTAALGAATKQYVDALKTYVDSSALFSTLLAGLTLSTAGATQAFGIAKGKAGDSTGVATMVLPSNYTKTAASWAVGTGNGALDTGIIANSSWYHVYVIKRLDTGVTDVIFSLSATLPALPTNYTLFRRIGALRTNATAQFIKFIQDGDTFTWDTPPADVAASNPGTASVIRTLSTPSGIRVEAIVMLGFGAPATTDNPAAIYLSDLLIADAAPNAGTGTLYSYSATVNASLVTRIFTNTSSQIRSRLQLSGVNTTIWMTTYGWVDRRGRDT